MNGKNPSIHMIPTQKKHPYMGAHHGLEYRENIEQANAVNFDICIQTYEK